MGAAAVWLIGWFVLGLIVGLIAAGRGRNAILWFIYGFLLWPVALLHILLAPPTPEEAKSRSEALAVAQGRVPCPHCAENILPQASVCPFCRSAVVWPGGAPPQRVAAPIAMGQIESAEQGASLGWALVLFALVIVGGIVAVVAAR